MREQRQKLQRMQRAGQPWQSSEESSLNLHEVVAEANPLKIKGARDAQVS